MDFEIIEKLPQQLELLRSLFPKGHFTTERIHRLLEFNLFEKKPISLLFAEALKQIPDTTVAGNLLNVLGN